MRHHDPSLPWRRVCCVSVNDGQMIQTFARWIIDRLGHSAAVRDGVSGPTREHEYWRECEGVEPSADGEGSLPADLKSVKPTGTHPLPRFS